MNYLEIDNKLISTPLWDIVLDIKNQLRNGKLRIVKLQGTKNIRITCPHHNNGLERNADCDIYIGPTLKNHSGEIIVAYGTVKCFACDFKTDFVGFVAECFEISYEDAETWLLDNYCDGIIQYQQELAPELSLNKKQIRNYIDESILDTLQSYHPYMEERKITREVAKEFEVKYNPQTKYLVFPVRDEKGQLVMFTQRSIEGKTFIIDAEKVKPVYLLYYLKKRNIQEAYVCESQINALTLWGHGLPGIALFGTGAKHQYDLLNQSNIRVYNLMFDGDKAGDNGIREFLKNIRKDVIVNIIKVPRGKDVNDLTYDELESLIANDSSMVLR